jgi:asparagine N-glycosylation enzyme membrane subunit Stt3
MFAKHRRALSDRHYQVFLAALVVMFVHLTEDALVHKENGSSLAAQLGSTALNLVLVAIGAGLYPLVWRWARPVLVLAFGVLAFSGGWRAHASDLLDGDAAGGDYTGTVYAVAGIVLIALALKLALDIVRQRPAPAAGED